MTVSHLIHLIHLVHLVHLFHLIHPPHLTLSVQEWYKKMLDKGIIERIVLDYKDIYKQALEDNIQSPAELPYFEGDFWPNVMEENIRELEQEEEARKRVSKNAIGHKSAKFL